MPATLSPEVAKLMQTDIEPFFHSQDAAHGIVNMADLTHGHRQAIVVKTSSNRPTDDPLAVAMASDWDAAVDEIGAEHLAPEPAQANYGYDDDAIAHKSEAAFVLK